MTKLKYVDKKFSPAIDEIIDVEQWDDDLRLETEDKRYLEELAQGGPNG